MHGRPTSVCQMCSELFNLYYSTSSSLILNNLVWNKNNIVSRAFQFISKKIPVQFGLKLLQECQFTKNRDSKCPKFWYYSKTCSTKHCIHYDASELVQEVWMISIITGPQSACESTHAHTHLRTHARTSQDSFWWGAVVKSKQSLFNGLEEFMQMILFCLLARTSLQQ